MTSLPVALVTGAAQGLGRALAQELAARGYALALADRDLDALEQLAVELVADGKPALAVRCDVAQENDWQALADSVSQHYGQPPALLVNNAGILVSGNCWEFSSADWQRVLGVNLTGVLHSLRTFVPSMIAAGGGHVVNVASLAGLAVGPWLAPYTVSKFGVVAVSESLALEARAGQLPIDVSVVCPGPVSTGIVHGLTLDERSDAGQMSQGLKQHVEAGLTPTEAARRVADGLAAKQFWIFTHEEAARQMASARVDRILAGQAPAVPA
jgi:NAD(P)-dependent dehydrogenase (short-subunit alcohol dehydrogenase family)